MCNGDCNSSRMSTGGTIAVLRPPHDSNEPAASCDLFFDNPQTRPGRTRAVFRARNGSCFDNLAGYFMLIHRDGDIRTRASMSDEVRNALHAIEIKPAMDEHQSTARMELPEALQLSVGAQGVVGRRVSIVTDMRDGGARVAEGIIGWN